MEQSVRLGNFFSLLEVLLGRLTLRHSFSLRFAPLPGAAAAGRSCTSLLPLTLAPSSIFQQNVGLSKDNETFASK